MDFSVIDKMMSPKDQYMRLRAERSGLVMDQIAFYAPDGIAELNIKCMLGLENADWTVDEVTGKVQVFGDIEGESRAKLQFNYDLGIELEILRYMDGPNWHAYRAANRGGPKVRPGSDCFMSHIGFHVNDDPLPVLPWPVAQRMVTNSHTNPAIAGRVYEYVIYDTKGTLGADLKYIKRIV